MAASLLVLTWHNIAPTPAYPDPEAAGAAGFAAQVAWLRRWTKVVPLDEGLDAIYSGQSLGPRAVAITFDDGYRDNVTIGAPALAANSLPATFFVVRDFITGDRVAWWERLSHALLTATVDSIEFRGRQYALGPATRDSYGAIAAELKIGGIEQREAAVLDLIARSGGSPLPERLFADADEIRSLHERGFTVASHSRDHAILSRERPEVQVENLTENQTYLTELVGRPARVLAYPNGNEDDADAHTQAAAKAAGHDYACTLVRAFAKPSDDQFRVRRMSVKPWWPVNKFALRMAKTLQYDWQLRRGDAA